MNQSKWNSQKTNKKTKQTYMRNSKNCPPDTEKALN